MRYKWLNKKSNERLIVFFNGWGMDESVVSHLEPENYDIVMIYDYNELDFDWSEIEAYKEKYLVAWSMGVMIATNFDKGYISKTAVNGTLKPIDNEFGIPTRIYDLTIKHLNPAKFMQNMFQVGETLPNVGREFENQKSELSAIKGYSANEAFKYDRVILSSEDKIIPTANQVKFWGIEPNFESGHCPFFKMSSWSELL